MTETQKVWVIYADYSLDGGGFGEPVCAFTTQQDAEAEAREMWGARRHWEVSEIEINTSRNAK
jgi:hypothetical protein